MKMRLRVFLLSFLAGGLVLATVLSVRANPSASAPDFRVQGLTGETITKESLKGKPTLLMFWASWCGVCQKELPNLKTLYEQKKAKGLQAVAIGFDDEEANIRGYVQAHAATFAFPTAYDRNDQVSSAFGVRATPTFVLLDAQGRIALVHIGGGFLRNPVFQRFIQEL